MWKEGDAYRARHGPAPPPLAWTGPAAPSRASSMRVIAVDDGLVGAPGKRALQRSGSLMSTASSGGTGIAAGGPGAQPVYNLVVDATGDLTPKGQQGSNNGSMATAGGAGGGALSLRTPFASALSNFGGASANRPAAAAAAVNKAPSDLSLMQYAQEHGIHHGMSAGSHPPAPPTNISLTSSTNSGTSRSIAAAAAAYLGSGSAHHSHTLSGSRPPPAPRGRSSTPTSRASSSGGAAHRIISASRGSNNGSVIGSSSTSFQSLFSSLASSAGSSHHGPLASALLLNRPASQVLGGSRTTASSNGSLAATTPAAGHHGRAPSAPRERTAAGSLRATLHTDTVQAAARAKHVPDSSHVISQSADFYSSSWRGSPGAGASSQYSGTSAAAPGRPASTIVRVLAPNGQPRKVPSAALLAAGAGAGGSGRAASAVAGHAGGGAGMLAPPGPAARRSNSYSHRHGC